MATNIPMIWDYARLLKENEELTARLHGLDKDLTKENDNLRQLCDLLITYMNPAQMHPEFFIEYKRLVQETKLNEKG